MANVKRPTLDQMRTIVQDLHMSMSDREVSEYLEVIEGTLHHEDSTGGAGESTGCTGRSTRRAWTGPRSRP